MVSGSKLKSKISDPKIIGSGYWVSWHISAARIKTHQDKVDFIRRFKSDVEGFPCGNCREDAVKYVKENPPEQYMNVKDAKTGGDIGISKYLWLFHNYVNRKIGKKEISWDTYLSLYYSQEMIEGCKNCGVKKEMTGVKLISKDMSYP